MTWGSLRSLVATTITTRTIIITKHPASVGECPLRSIADVPLGQCAIVARRCLWFKLSQHAALACNGKRCAGMWTSSKPLLS